MTYRNYFLHYLFLMIAGLPASAQDSVGNEYHFKKAEQFKKSAQSDSAIYYFKQAAAVFTQAGNKEGIVSANNQLGILLTRQDKYQEATVYLQEALQLGDSSSNSHALALATTYINLGVIYAAEKQYDESLKFHHQSLALRKRILGEQSADVATNYGNIGNVYFRMKDALKAIEFHEQARQIREQLFGKSSVEVIESYSNLGNAYKENKQYAEALKYYEQALANKIVQRGEGHKDLGRFYSNLSSVHDAMQNKEQADFFKQKAANLTRQ